MQQTMQQQRAQYALYCVETAKAKGVNQKEYKSYASALPAMIHMNGLGQAAAFFQSSKGTHGELYQLLSDWLCRPNQPYANYDDLLDGIMKGNMHTYRLAQAEAQALMDWVKKFAKAFMQDKSNDGDETPQEASS